MATEQHSRVLMQQLHGLYRRGVLTDVVLTVEGQAIKTHAAVLVAFSAYFQSLLEGRTEPHMTEFQLQG